MSTTEKIAYAIIIFIFVSVGVFYVSPLQFLRGHGHSMEPMISDGDAIIITPVSREEIQEGDVITFRQDGGLLITHKVIGFENGKIITHGINLPEGDVEIVEYSDVVGELVFKIPKAGSVIEYLNSSLGLILLILIPAGLIIFNEARKIREELDQKHKEGQNTTVDFLYLINESF